MRPIALSTGPVTLTQGSKVNVDITKLQAHGRYGVLIDRINFVISNQTAVGPEIQVRLTIGKMALTNGYVPVWNLGPVVNSEVDDTAPRSYVWNLGKPLYVGPASILSPSLYYSPDGATANTVVVMTYFGRALASASEIPKKQTVPWCSVFYGALNDATQRSVESDLVNPFDEPLHVRYLTGRIARTAAGTTSDAGQSQQTTRSAYQKDTLVRMWDNRGKIVIRDAMPFSEAFDFMRRAWSVNTVMTPHSYYILDLVGSTGRPTVGLVGYREVISR